MDPLTQFINLMLATTLALLPIVNPFSAAPVFLAITAKDSPEYRRKQLIRTCFYSVAILVTTFFAGRSIISFFGISIPGIRIAGGLLICQIGFRMLSDHSSSPSVDEHNEALVKPDIALTPMAMPLLSGPGSMAVVIGASSNAVTSVDYLAILTAILLVMSISYIVLRGSQRIVPMLGLNGLHALTKTLGFLLLCVGIQFIINGCSAILSAICPLITALG